MTSASENSRHDFIFYALQALQFNIMLYFYAPIRKNGHNNIIND